MRLCSKLFYSRNPDVDLSLLAVKFVDDVLLFGTMSVLRKVVKEISSKYKVGTIVYV